MAKIREIPLNKLKPQGFIKAKIEEIAGTVGGGTAINALSGGVDSSVVTVLAFKSLGHRITREVAGVVSVTYSIARKPPSTIEAV